MTKHRNRRTKRRSQKGGEYQDPNAQSQGWFSGITSGITGLFSSGVKKAKEGLVNANTYIGDAAQSSMDAAQSSMKAVGDATSSAVNTVSAPFSSSSDTTNQNGINGNPSQSGMTGNSYGQQAGRRRKRCRSMKGGKGGSNLAYYAAPVSGLKVAEPTYMINSNTNQPKVGGSRRRKSRGRKSRRTRRNKRH
jgi:hypothetical protein